MELVVLFMTIHVGYW